MPEGTGSAAAGSERSEKALYVWQTFEALLRGRSILDVGADECHLRDHLDADASYWGIGLGGTPDQVIDLEREPIPFGDRSFDCVLCLDVLEHLSNPHAVFDEVCRVARSHVVVSLPDPWTDAYRALRRGPYRDGLAIKYYGLPAEAPGDRHKWFFSAREAAAFVEGRAARNEMAVIEQRSASHRPHALRNPVRALAEWVLFRNGVGLHEVYAGTQWFVLERPQSDPAADA